MTRFRTLALSFSIFLFALAALPAHAASECSFTRDLKLGDTGEDVRCLQRYLNGSGFPVASSGVGSPGNETSLYRTLTVEAVTRWQSANGISATGTFGPLSRARYQLLTGGGSTPVTPSVPATNETAAARTAILNAIRAYEDALDDASSEDVEDALEYLFDAFRAFLNNNMALARSLAQDAEDEAYDADGSDDDDSDQDEAEERIQEVEDQLDDARDDVSDAEDDGEDVDDAEDLLDEAQDLIDEAWEAYDDDDFDEAVDLADEADDRIEEALDEIDANDASEEDARDALDDAADAIQDAREEIDDAEDDGDDTDDAEDLFDDAMDAYNDAQDAFDDEEYDDAVEYAKDAEDFAEEAVDAL
jgi:peptidoglycan hydrolase-like protein with peptidoglycan-binding domain